MMYVDNRTANPVVTRFISRDLLAIVLVFQTCPAVSQAVRPIGEFNADWPGLPVPWEVIRFDEDIPPTLYRVIDWDGIDAVESLADASMALLARPVEVNLEETPVLCWRWRVDHPVMQADMTRRSGDDYAARVYVSFDIPDHEMSFGTRFRLSVARNLYGDHVPDAAISYVWDNRQPVGTQMPNAYTDRTQMLVLRTGDAESGRWINERRNVMADFRTIFGHVEASIYQLALATDTDNTGGQARAGFADFHFVNPETDCQFLTR